MAAKRKIQIPRDVEAAGPEAVKIYRSAIRKGGTPMFAEMCALRKGTRMSGSEDALHNFYGSLGKQLGEEQAAMVVAAAKKKGYTPGENDVYMPSMCRPIGSAGGKGGVGDPIAFLSPGQGRREMKKRIETHFGTESEGWVTTKARPTDRSTLPTPGLAGDIVEDLYQERVLANPDLLKSVGEEKHKIVADHGHASKDKDLVG